MLNKGYSSELASQVRQSLNLTKDVDQEHENLRLETEKLWHKNSRIDLKKGAIKSRLRFFAKDLTSMNATELWMNWRILKRKPEFEAV